MYGVVMWLGVKDTIRDHSNKIFRVLFWYVPEFGLQRG